MRRRLGASVHWQGRARRHQLVRDLLPNWIVQDRTNSLRRANTTNEGSPDRVDQSQLAQIPPGENLPPAPIDPSVDKWFFISGAAM